MPRGSPEGHVGRGLAFGEALWSGSAERLLRSPPWRSLRSYRVVSLGPLVRGRTPVLLVLGGRDEGRSAYGNGVWRSSDAGVTWEEVSPNDEGYIGNDGRVVHRKWCGRESFAAAAGWTEEAGRMRGLVYVVGGLGPSLPMGDVWVSEDLGKTFTCTCSEAPFGRRVGSGLAVCPGFPQRLVLVGGGWGDSPARWDCWLSLDAGEHWAEVETPENAVQRLQPALLLPWRGTLVVLGGRQARDGPQGACKDAYVAKVQWNKRNAFWRPLQVRCVLGKEDAPLEELPSDERPWFLSHFTVYDQQTGDFLGLSGVSQQLELVVGRLPKRLLLGPLERTPGKTGQLQAIVTACPSRLPGAEESLEAPPSACEAPQFLVPPWVDLRSSQKAIEILRRWKSRSAFLDSAHALLAADSIRLFFITSDGVWSSCSYARQVRLLERIGQQVQERHGLVPEVWHRVLLALLGGKRSMGGQTPTSASAAGVQAAGQPATRAAVAQLPAPEEDLPPEALVEHENSFFIAGTWDNFKHHKMAWDGSAFVYYVTLGAQGRESFQVLQDSKWELALYPSVPDGNPFIKHVLMGPDASGHGKNWTIGFHESDKGYRDSCYRVELVLHNDSKRPGRVWWKNVGVGSEAEEAKAKTMRRLQSIAKAREQRQLAEPGLARGRQALPEAEEPPWSLPADAVPETPAGDLALASSEIVDVREPLLLLGTCNHWNIEEAKENYRFKRFGGSASQGYLESRLIVRCPKGSFEFQVVSARRLWDWRLFPCSEKGELVRGKKYHVQVSLFTGTQHDDLHGKNFSIRNCQDKAYVMVSLSAHDGLFVWYE